MTFELRWRCCGVEFDGPRTFTTLRNSGEQLADNYLGKLISNCLGPISCCEVAGTRFGHHWPVLLAKYLPCSEPA